MNTLSKNHLKIKPKQSKFTCSMHRLNAKKRTEVNTGWKVIPHTYDTFREEICPYT